MLLLHIFMLCYVIVTLRYVSLCYYRIMLCCFMLLSEFVMLCYVIVTLCYIMLHLPLLHYVIVTFCYCYVFVFVNEIFHFSARDFLLFLRLLLQL